jgi:hypothetical protein
MKEYGKSDKDQWIPWEIAYSLREQSRGGQNSRTNAILAVVLPDEDNSYDYFMEYNPECGSTTYKTDRLFAILKNNMFNIKNADTYTCNGNTIYRGYSSYIYAVKWDTFISNINTYIDIALNIWRNRNDYDICKSV